MKSMFFILTAGSALILFGSCANETPKSTNREEVICVKAEKLAETNGELQFRYPGILSSKKLIKLSFKTGGIIAHINVDESSQVKKEQVIASLDMTEIISQVEQARLAFEKTKRDHDRVKSLYNDTVATLEQLQDATSAYEAALENKNIADFNLKYSKITAPADGRIITRLAEEHELIGPGMPVFVFCEQGKEEWVVKAGLSDKDIVRISKGDKAEVVFDAFPGKTFTAYVSQIAEMADQQTGTFEVEITVVPQGEKLKNGLVAKVTIKSSENQLVTLVPPESVTEADGKKGYVYVVENGSNTAKRIEVTIAYFENKYIAVIEPLNKLGTVITNGASYLEDGSKISIKQ